MSFRKEAVIKARGFDERFGGSAHLEETDLCLRICGAGYKIVFNPKAELIHLKDTKGGCRAENYKQWFYWYGHNNMLFFLKNFSRYLFPIFFASSFIRLILSACKRYNPMVVIWGIRGYQNGLITYKSSSFSNLSPLEKGDKGGCKVQTHCCASLYPFEKKNTAH